MEKLEKENGMEKLMLETLMEQQREYFASGATLPVKVRMEALSRLEKALQKQEQILCKALHTDLGKSKTESVMCEIGLVQGGNPLDEAALRAALQNKTCQNTAGAVRCKKLSKPFSLWQCADYEPVELPCSADVRTAGRCHCGRKYCGGKTKCLCTG